MRPLFLFLSMIHVFICDAAFALPDLDALLPISWIQIIGDDKLSIRVIDKGDRICPTVSIGGRSEVKRMAVRAKPDNMFVDMVCELEVPINSREIRIGYNLMPSFRLGMPSKIAFLGDTGNTKIINYNSKHLNGEQKQWKLNKLLNNISAASPDLIVHLGDYVYGYWKGSYYNNGNDASEFDGWYKEWIIPMRSIANKAIFAFVRGNHENCKGRHYLGWSRYFSAEPYENYNEGCVITESPWILKFPNKSYALFFDSSGLGEITAMPFEAVMKESLEDTYVKAIDTIPESFSDMKFWIITHKPFIANVEHHGDSITYNGNKIFRKSLIDNISNKLVAVISGHVHIGHALFTIIKGHKVLQVISGNAGNITNFDKYRPFVTPYNLGEVVVNSEKSHESIGYVFSDAEYLEEFFFRDENDEMIFDTLS